MLKSECLNSFLISPFTYHNYIIVKKDAKSQAQIHLLSSKRTAKKKALLQRLKIII